ncbi:16S rRNA (guanine(527)-N(7))-methyltransferase RsmG [Facklamia miroungae]|uniref:Ribosomal RNA small subunit methyltransferase G n=1 Tax=Facklamia miroungae TaxID=120956 RepID=A0A1G7SYD2_9LACT|nr:16S rRNA (guanine(527)-N(7))-methyltransferase RsmG [Facklamia miroungae]NKZ29484.1 16S rRNA (guanine(527)-N(7))-methyltransferase RsmG [Facklamia miroungae]SDG28096.1 16S rRNA (guanine527-N7)-methyltransferase [Facklamia miroungae]
MNEDQFIKALQEQGISVNLTQHHQYSTYYQKLIEWNQRVNLTAITNKEEVYLKHFYDSLLSLWHFPIANKSLKVCDVGAGAGFPSLPIKIIYPEIKLTIIDSLNKRIQFLTELTAELGLDQIKLLHGRAEDFGQDSHYRGQFDLVTARAVAPLNVLAEYCLPFLKKGGQFIVLKGSHSQTQVELQEAAKAIQVLGAKLAQVKQTHLPEDEGERTLLLIEKTLDTPNKYPRKAGKPSKQPIK